MLYYDKEYIGNKIRDYRKKANLTQAQLAEKIGISSKQLSRLEIAKYVPSVSSFLKIIDVLKIDVKEFGVERNVTSNPEREEFIKLVYSLNDRELSFFLQTTKDLIKNIKYLQK